MIQVRFHGRGGQGVVTAADLLAAAAFLDGRHAQSFPSFGSERMGAPVAAFCRVADRPIRTRQPVTAPDVVVVADPTLVHHVPLLDGLADGGLVVVNTGLAPERLGLGQREGVTVLAVPASELARRHMGRPLPNAALLGALAARTGLVTQASLEAALRERFSPTVAAGNIEAARAGWRLQAGGGGAAAGAGAVGGRSGAGPA